MQHLLGYREVIPDQTIPEKWQEIKLNTGNINVFVLRIYCYKFYIKI